MRFPIGLRLFFAVLLAILVVAASGIGLMRQKVLGSFSDYAVQIELDRLGELAGDLGRQYRASGGWNFIPKEEREAWIRAELARLQNGPVTVVRSTDDHGATNSADGSGVTPVTPPTPVDLPPLPAPPAPPVPPTPPAMPAAPANPGAAAPAPRPPAPAPTAPRAPAAAPAVSQLGLIDRISLVDKDGNWLAGRVPGREPSARRPILAGGATVGYLQVAQTLEPSDALALAFLDQLSDSILWIVAASIALSAVAAVLLASHFRTPIRTLADGAGRLADGNFDTRIDSARSDELGELARAFNQLAERLQEAESSRRQWVADTSHELRTPLAVLRAQLEAIQDGVRPADPATVAAMLRQVLSLNTLIDELYALARADVGELTLELEKTDVTRLAQDCAEAFRDRIEAAGLQLEFGPSDSAFVAIDRSRMEQVFNNLFENSVRYTNAGGRIALRVEQRQQVHIHIDDSAPGVPDAALPRLAERFYRVDASRSRANGGAGLGLALCERIVAAHGGTLSFSHSALGGLRTTITLPLA